MASLEELKHRRDKLAARIQQVEAREKAGAKKLEDKTKVLVGAALLTYLSREGAKDSDKAWLVKMLDGFLTRPKDRIDILGEDGQGSPTLLRLLEKKS